MDNAVSPLEEPSGIVIPWKTKRVHRSAVKMVDLHDQLGIYEVIRESISIIFQCANPLFAFGALTASSSSAADITWNDLVMKLGR
jgi:hypothetical protein